MATKIQTQTGNLMNVTSGHVVHGCNAQGVMNSGVALGVKNTWPAAYEDYRKRWGATTSGLEMGAAYPVQINEDPGLVIWNAITQNLYGAGTRQISYDAIVSCFETINAQLHLIEEKCDNFPVDVHIPLIGAARGGGNWGIISAIIEESLDFPVTLWLPDSTVTTL